MTALVLPRLRTAAAPFAVPNFRRWFAGQIVSVSGTWMQTVAEIWLVYTITGSALAVGLTPALQFTPILFGGLWGGVLADRVSKRRLLAVTQAAMAVPAATLWVLTVSGSVQLWMIYGLVFARGCVLAIDNPARQSFFAELVGRDRLPSAIALNSALINGARIVGPSLAGVLIATVGVGPCFLLNALSFGAVVVALLTMEDGELHHDERAARAPGQVRAALHTAWRTPELRRPLLLMAVVGTLAYNFQVLLPLMAHAFGAGGGTYGGLTAAMGAGAIVGALAVATRRRPTPRLVNGSAIALGALCVVAALAPTLPTELGVLVLLGAASIVYASSTNAALQLAVAPAMRGRVMALYAVVFLGSTPIGSPLTGWFAGVEGPRWAFAAGGLAALVAGLAAAGASRRRSVAAAARAETARAPRPEAA